MSQDVSLPDLEKKPRPCLPGAGVDLLGVAPELRLQLQEYGVSIDLLKVGDGDDAFYIGRSVIPARACENLEGAPYPPNSILVSTGSWGPHASVARCFCKSLDKTLGEKIGGWRLRLPFRREWMQASEQGLLVEAEDGGEWVWTDGPSDPSVGLPGYTIVKAGEIGVKMTKSTMTASDEGAHADFRLVLESPASRLRSKGWEDAVLAGYHARKRCLHDSFQRLLDDGTGRRFDLGKGVFLDMVGEGAGTNGCYVSRCLLSNSFCMRLAEIAGELGLEEQTWVDGWRSRLVPGDPYFDDLPAEVYWIEAWYFVSILNDYLLWERGGLTFSLPYKERDRGYDSSTREDPCESKAAIGHVACPELVGVSDLDEVNAPAQYAYWLTDTASLEDEPIEGCVHMGRSGVEHRATADGDDGYDDCCFGISLVLS